MPAAPRNTAQPVHRRTACVAPACILLICVKVMRQIWRRGRVSDWWAVTGSNRRPSRCKRDALPTELTAPTLLHPAWPERTSVSPVMASPATATWAPAPCEAPQKQLGLLYSMATPNASPTANRKAPHAAARGRLLTIPSSPLLAASSGPAARQASTNARPELPGRARPLRRAIRRNGRRAHRSTIPARYLGDRAGFTPWPPRVRQCDLHEKSPDLAIRAPKRTKRCRPRRRASRPGRDGGARSGDDVTHVTCR